MEEVKKKTKTKRWLRWIVLWPQTTTINGYGHTILYYCFISFFTIHHIRHSALRTIALLFQSFIQRNCYIFLFRNSISVSFHFIFRSPFSPFSSFTISNKNLITGVKEDEEERKNATNLVNKEPMKFCWLFSSGIFPVCMGRIAC